MGRIKTSFIKRVGKELFEKHSEEFSTDYSKNKQVLKGLVEIKSKKLMNILAGYVTSLKKQQSG